MIGSSLNRDALELAPINCQYQTRDANGKSDHLHTTNSRRKATSKFDKGKLTQQEQAVVS